MVLFEGWCVGARPQPEAELDKPINSLEAEEDKDARWRRYVNEQLAASYKQLFGRLDLLIMLKIPSFESVYEWRSLQERKLAASAADKTASHVMDEATLQRFIMHYERLTRYMLAEMPQRADIVLKLNSDHTIEEVIYQSSKAAGSQS